jgi:uncharacterized protein YkwD
MHRRTTHLLRGVQSAALVLAVLLPVACADNDSPMGPSPALTSPAPPAPTPLSGATESEVLSLINLVNTHRLSRGLPALVWDSRVAAVAEAHSQDMIDRNFYGHINPDGEGPNDRLREAGIEYLWWAENYAYGFSTAAGAFNWWMNSPSHRANLESTNVTHHGIGKVGTVWTHNFIKPKATTTGVETAAIPELTP